MTNDEMPSLCASCKRRKDVATCSAFPDGIPQDILMFAADHREPIKGDHNLQYLPKEGREVEFKAWEQYAALMGDIAASEPVVSPRRSRG